MSFGFHMQCNCEFSIYDDGDTEESFHYKRKCTFCGHKWYGLHCEHDGYQNPCPNCFKKPIPITSQPLVFPCMSILILLSYFLFL